LVIILILATLLLPVLSSMRPSGLKPELQCMANLHSLYAAAESFVQQNGSWPQISMADDSDPTDQVYASSWIAALSPFGPTQKTWVLSHHPIVDANPDLTKPENVRVDYLASAFDDKPMNPHQWPRQPGSLKRRCAREWDLIIFTDGSISDLNTIAHRPGISCR